MARFVLVHGAFAGAWIWRPLQDRLKAAGHSVEAFDLPGLGDDRTPTSEVTLDACAARLCEVLASSPEPALVAGNSMGGIIATQGAARSHGRVAGLIYVAAFVPKDGQSLLDLTKLPEGADDQVQANIVIEGASGRNNAGRRVAPGVVRFLHRGCRGVGYRTATAASGCAVHDAGFHRSRNSRRHPPVLRVVHARSSYSARAAATDDC
jgi:pimeloyl-ACP methyl ester carboxylesterase